ncbi:VOC family protein [Nocardia sp. 2]|uniref:VOC family protein n=1 Tax=Nocardia acididurans TaxID=2802282 RepID=A0ABS1M0F5_9NOCA|nr:VOC family protein [Nocardia acididurans]MBL1073991.1 VOC family protein [Nocardia acididurans]
MPADFTPGAPCWFDVTAPDIPAAADFYTGLFGWSAVDTGPDSHHYTLLLQDGHRVAGVAAATTPDGVVKPALWLPYFAVADAETTTATAVHTGAGVFVGPTEVPGELVFAILTDPDGAPYGLAQLLAHPGTERWGEVDNPCWVEYGAARTPSEAMAHYAEIFGWQYGNAAWETAAVNPYQALSVDPGREFGGAHIAVPGEPAPYWSMSIRVAGVDETVSRAIELGGKVLKEPEDLPGPSRLAVLADPAGAGFAVMSVG